MHVLTKIFIVLVALLAVMLVPLIVVYAKNESNFKAKYLEADQQRAAAVQNFQRADSNFGRRQAEMQAQITSLTEQGGELRGELQEKDAEIARLRSDLAIAQTQQAQLNSQVAMIGGRIDASQTLIENLVKEANQLRVAALDSERRNAELEAQVRQQGRELEVANSTVRTLQEEVKRLEEAEAEAVNTIAMYRERYGEIGGEVGVGAVGGPIVPIDRKVTATVVDVREEEGVVLAEINAGQRDGIREGWIMTISDGSGHYIGRLRIIKVDINRAVGIAEAPTGDPVIPNVGYRAHALPRG